MCRTAVASVWFGIVTALGFIETPLKFLAPGMTLDVALGLGRLVLTTADVLSGVLLVVLTGLTLVRPRPGRPALISLGALWVVVVVQVALVRPFLNARTDIVLAGGQAGESQLHTVYIALDVLILVLLVVYTLLAARRRVAPVDRAPSTAADA